MNHQQKSTIRAVGGSAGQPGDLQCITARSALHYHQNEQPTHWDLNVYRGCTHGCHYCFARYSHEYLGSGDFFGHILAKTNLPALLHREISRPGWKKEAVNLGGVSDSYQPAEASLRLMPEVLKVFIHHANPVLISTKSDLIVRDAALFEQLAARCEVRVAASIITTDEPLSALLEPGASPPSHRFAMLRALRKPGVSTYILLMPVLPYLTDDFKSLEAIYQQASKAGVNGIAAWPLHMRGQVSPAFLSFLKTHFPHLVPLYVGLFNRGRVSESYLKSIREMIALLRERYGIGGIPPFGTSAQASEQLSLF